MSQEESLSANDPILTYSVKKLDIGYMAWHTVNPEVSIYSENEDEIDNKINDALQGYVDLFPFKTHKILVENRDIRIKRD